VSRFLTAPSAQGRLFGANVRTYVLTYLFTYLRDTKRNSK